MTSYCILDLVSSDTRCAPCPCLNSCMCKSEQVITRRIEPRLSQCSFTSALLPANVGHDIVSSREIETFSETELNPKPQTVHRSLGSGQLGMQSRFVQNATGQEFPLCPHAPSWLPKPCQPLNFECPRPQSSVRTAPFYPPHLAAFQPNVRCFWLHNAEYLCSKYNTTMKYSMI